MSKYLEAAKKIRPLIETAVSSLDDAEASKAPQLTRGMTYDGSLITAGTRINWGGQLKRAAVDLWDADLYNPDNAPELWEDVAYRDGYRLIPETITATQAFALDELGWWGDVLYRSLRNGNTFNPDVTPEWWQAVE